jgi:hypothetical protein
MSSYLNSHCTRVNSELHGIPFFLRIRHRFTKKITVDEYKQLSTKSTESNIFFIKLSFIVFHCSPCALQFHNYISKVTQKSYKDTYTLYLSRANIQEYCKWTDGSFCHIQNDLRLTLSVLWEKWCLL